MAGCKRIVGERKGAERVAVRLRRPGHDDAVQALQPVPWLAGLSRHTRTATAARRRERPSRSSGRSGAGLARRDGGQARAPFDATRNREIRRPDTTRR